MPGYEIRRDDLALHFAKPHYLGARYPYDSPPSIYLASEVDGVKPHPPR